MANKIERRGFFGMLLGAPTAAQVMAEIPEVKRVEKLESGGESAFVLSHPGSLGERALSRIGESWDRIWESRGVKAPLAIILEEGMTIQQIDFKSALKRNA